MPLNRVQFDSKNNVNVLGSLSAPNLVARQGTTAPIDLSSSPSVTGAGMDLITPTSVVGGIYTGGAISFNNVTSFSVNGCFSQKYSNYRLVINSISPAQSGIFFRLRSSGNDSILLYDTSVLKADSNIAVAINTSNTNSLTLGFSVANFVNRFSSGDISQPYLNNFTYASFVNSESSPAISALSSGVSSLIHKLPTSFDGFSYNASGATISGTARIYGYRES